MNLVLLLINIAVYPTEETFNNHYLKLLEVIDQELTINKSDESKIQNLSDLKKKIILLHDTILSINNATSFYKAMPAINDSLKLLMNFSAIDMINLLRRDNISFFIDWATSLHLPHVKTIIKKEAIYHESVLTLTIGQQPIAEKEITYVIYPTFNDVYPEFNRLKEWTKEKENKYHTWMNGCQYYFKMILDFDSYLNTFPSMD